MSRFFHRDDETPKTPENEGELSLLSIPGVGRSKAQALINAGYRSLRDVAEAPLDELMNVPGLGRMSAIQVQAGARYMIDDQRDKPRPFEANIVPLQRAGVEGAASGPEGARPQRGDEATTAAPATSGVTGTVDTAGDQATAAVEPAAGTTPAETLSTTARDEAPPTATDETTRTTSGEHVPSPTTPDEAPCTTDIDEPSDAAGPPISSDTRPASGDRGAAATMATADAEAHSAREGPSEGVDADGAKEGPSEADEPVQVHLTVHVENSLLSRLPGEVAREFEVVPLRLLGETLLVAADSPLSEARLAELEERTGFEIKVIPSQVANVQSTLRNLYEDNKLRSRPKGLGEILIDLGLLTGEQLAKALAQQVRENNPFFQPALSVDQSVLQVVPEVMARRYNVLPLLCIDGDLVMATSEYLSKDRLTQIEERTGLKPHQVIVGPSELAEAMSQTYRVRQRYELRQMWLGEILISRGLISRKQLDTCLAAQQDSGHKLGELLVQHDFISEEALYPILAEKLGMEYRHFEQGDVNHQLSYLVSERFAERNLLLPLKLDFDEGILEVAVADPTNLQVRDMLASVAEAQGQRLKLVLATPRRLRESIQYTYNFHRQMETVADDLEIEADTDWDEEADRHDLVISEDLPRIRRIVNKLLYEAVTVGCSDIHIENLEIRTQVRFRIDGILHERTTPINKGNIQKIISVLKIDSGLNIAERRRSQDGVFKMRIGKDRHIDFRINVHATQFGEDAVIRILDRARNLMSLADLGLHPSIRERYESLVKNPQGLILITGPTGSGKTTTLYSTLEYLNTGDQKIVTAEDPVEYHLDGITQYQVNNTIGNTFAEYTRRFLRKDPDIILVGETRDDETAIACIRAAMTGHLVFSTLHTNDAVSVVQRLRDLGVDSSSISDALLCVMQQRLARRNCPDCRKPYTPEPGIMRDFFPTGQVPAEAHFIRGTGCVTCHGKGLKGRVGLYEFWEVKRATREVIGAHADEAMIRETADGDGLTPLVEDALRKVYEGTTTLEELRRVVPIEQIRNYTGYYKHA